MSSLPDLGHSSSEPCSLCHDTAQIHSHWNPTIRGYSPDGPPSALSIARPCPNGCASRLWDLECERAERDADIRDALELMADAMATPSIRKENA